ncbi:MULTISPECIES: type IV secretion protein IcmC [Legionella]|uniref:Type IV secretion protein IcmC n=1 Tax=Legionella septentrionalis TaxID=2498109 RepID=A0A3S0VN39_9GAMM|nr:MULTISPECIES: type IV secretion protein IcmC [Legionella]MCP0913189.1 type IV secretion protein IcmC [Legionella sp. 27cVA30]RUQ88051.1 type IV secretion protein IcmC [Legionella septentrionalis]RUR02430.1 type IV secretion protein IcmC [Legionella septentrionalis]RUR17088.1 type IV secretion protein IcmC [Legionella septentrionalis]
MADWNAIDWITSNVDILNNIANSLKPVQRLLTGAAYLIGLSFAFKALYSLKVYGEARTMMSSNASIKEPVTYLLVAAIFIYFPTAFQVLLNTTFGYANPLSYSAIGSENKTLNTLFGPNSLVGKPLTIIIQTIGLIAFIRGWVLISRSASQGQPPGGTGKGMMHVFGGILAMNIVGTLQIINNTLYGTS